MKEFRVGVLISGRGSNLQALIDKVHQKGKNPRIKIVVVISDNPEAYGLVRAQRANIPTHVVERKNFSSREEFDKAIAKILNDYRVDLVVLAGFMRIMSSWFVERFFGKAINIHPALLPSFPGLHAQKQAVDYGVRYSGCTVHFIDAGVDTGPIILQKVVPVYQNDTEETLARRILKWEHVILPRAVKLIAKGRVSIRGRKVYIKEDVFDKIKNWLKKFFIPLLS